MRTALQALQLTPLSADSLCGYAESFELLGNVSLERPSARRRDEFLAAVARSRRVHRHFASPPRDRQTFDEWLQRISRPAHEGHFVISVEDDALVGVINVNEIVRGAFESGYLGYYAFEPYVGRGLMSAGLRRVISRAFGELRLHRLEANIQPDNVASLAIVQRHGFTCEGFSPRYLKLGGRWRDHERWALLREEWRLRKSRSTPGKPAVVKGQ